MTNYHGFEMQTQIMQTTTFPFSLAPLPYAKNALSPHINEQTLEVHHGKHHNTYIQNLNKLIENTEFSKKSLEEIILATHNNEKNKGVFNNAAQVWNHNFLWHSMTPNTRKPSSEILEKITHAFGSYEEFITEFKKAGLGQFGSGWVWLVFDTKTKKLKIEKTSNAENPLTNNQFPLLTCDVWEHAYYLDYKNDRATYLETFLKHLINWDFAESNFKKIQ
ncbi:MAG: superoxide dismutase [Rickettsiales bacterium]|nr:superoxide dismutase [Rickettsiales bacterium]